MTTKVRVRNSNCEIEFLYLFLRALRGELKKYITETAKQGKRILATDFTDGDGKLF